MAERDIFALFALQPLFEVSRGYLDGKYLELQKTNHPDVASTGHEASSAEINRAYRILCSDMLRADYIVKEKYKISALPTPDYAFLEAIMEMEEEIAGGVGESLLLAIEKKLAECFEDFAKQVRADDKIGAATCLSRAQYWNRLLQIARAKYESA